MVPKSYPDHILICISEILSDNLEAIISSHKIQMYLGLDPMSLNPISFVWTAMCRVIHQISHLGSLALCTVKKRNENLLLLKKKKKEREKKANETHMLNFPSHSTSDTIARRKQVIPCIMLNSLLWL